MSTIENIRVASATVDAIEAVRKSTTNQLSAMDRSGTPKFDYARVEMHFILDTLKEREKFAIRQLEIEMERHPLWPWCQQQKGLGSKTVGRLLAEIGDPYWNETTDQPRSVSQLWSYVGVGDPDRRTRNMMTREEREQRGPMSQAERFALGNPRAKMRAWVIVSTGVKMNGKVSASGNRVNPTFAFYDVFEARKASTEGKLHDRPCVKCGRTGKPAPVGSPWKDGHRQADAIRLTIKRGLLLGLWREAKRLHELPADHPTTDAHTAHVGGSDFPADHSTNDAQRSRVGGDQASDLDLGVFDAHPTRVGVAPTPPASQRTYDDQTRPAGGSDFPADQREPDAQPCGVGGEHA